MRGDTLVVQNNKSGWGGYPGANPGPIEVSIGSHDISDAWVNGAGSLMIDRVRGLNFALSVQGSGRAEIAAADADRVSVSLIGTASAKLAGKAKKLTALVRGISALDASSLAATDASIGTRGRCDDRRKRQGRSDHFRFRPRHHPAGRKSDLRVADRRLDNRQRLPLSL